MTTTRKRQIKLHALNIPIQNVKHRSCQPNRRLKTPDRKDEVYGTGKTEEESKKWKRGS